MAVAEWRFIPETEGMKEFTASGVLFSGLSGANAYIDTVPARTYVLEYDPARMRGVEEASASRSATPTSSRTRTKHARTWRTVTSGASQKESMTCVRCMRRRRAP